jgi:hypothetical protein
VSLAFMGDKGLPGISCDFFFIPKHILPLFSLHFAVYDLNCILGVSSFIMVIELSALGGVPLVLGGIFMFVGCCDAFDEIPTLGENLSFIPSSYPLSSIYVS